MGGIDDALLPGFSINIRGRRRIGIADGLHERLDRLSRILLVRSFRAAYLSDAVRFAGVECVSLITEPMKLLLREAAIMLFTEAYKKS